MSALSTLRRKESTSDTHNAHDHALSAADLRRRGAEDPHKVDLIDK